ncbi:MAG: phospho-sugar mutase [Microthrixaceae bacterium]
MPNHERNPDGSARHRASAMDRARRWHTADPDPDDRARLLSLIDEQDRSAIDGLFDGRLHFGTAGLRAPVGVGPNRMNRLMSAITALATARVLMEQAGTDPVGPVVVAHDARRGSREFAAEITDALCASGLDAMTISGPAPTPLAAFAVRHLDASAGMVVTASHNPARDNGIKVYWSDGAQIAPPVDRQISDAMDNLFEDLWSGGQMIGPHGSPRGPVKDLGSVEEGTPLVEAYLSEAAGLPRSEGHHPVVVAYTALHGVGADLLELAIRRMQSVELVPVASQREPDPLFPTVEFPNPEEPGAMREVLELADAVSADLAIANDPDADRLAIAAPAEEGGWQVLSGDETGALLAHHLFTLTSDTDDRLVATTVVSSRLLGSMARADGVHFEETLTGFKWLCRPALEHPEWTQVLIYEEALGYATSVHWPGTRTGSPPRWWRSTGTTTGVIRKDRLGPADDLAERHGAHVTANGSRRLDGPDARDRLDGLAAELVAHPPTTLGGNRVSDSDQPAGDVLRLWLTDGTRVVLRPSGTEPKFKYYCEAIEPVGTDRDSRAARRRARLRLRKIERDLEALFGSA